MGNEGHNPSFPNEAEQKAKFYDVYQYFFFAVLIFGILGNTLVIISILRLRHLKSNYYFLVRQLAICDLTWLLMIFLGKFFLSDKKYCLIDCIVYIFQVSGISIMLIISVLRYRATLHPFKPAISRKKLTVICGLVYIVGLIGGWAIGAPLCLIQEEAAGKTYNKLFRAYIVLCFYNFPTVFMMVVYYKILRALIEQNKSLKSVCSNPVTRNTSSSFKILRHIRNRRTFVVCLATVLCYGVGNFPMTVFFFLYYIAGFESNYSIFYFYNVGIIMRIAGSCSVNPLIYGIFDKKLLTFWKLCPKRKPMAK